jgi:hypothetical protein
MVHKTVYHLVIKNDIHPTWINLGNIILSEICQTKVINIIFIIAFE